MPVTVTRLQEETKPLFFYMGEETPDNLVQFTYRPNSFTPGLEDKFSQASEADVKSVAYLEILCDLVVSWDVYDKPEEEGGKPIPFDKTNLEPLKTVPSAVFTKLMNAITEDQKPKKEQPTGSLIG